MARVSGRRLVAALFGLLVSILIAGCSSSGSYTSSSSSPTASAPSLQDLYATRLSKDYQSLDRGVLSYSPIRSLSTGTTVPFEVTVTDVGRGPQYARLTAFGGMTVYQQDVPTHGIVGVQIVTCENLTCDSMSSAKQPVLYKGQHKEWHWLITADGPGPALITLRADTYDLASSVPLSEEIIRVGATVVPTSSYSNAQSHKKLVNAVRSVNDWILKIGYIATALAAVVGLGLIVRKLRKNKAKRKRRAKAKGRKPDTSKQTKDEQRRAEQERIAELVRMLEAAGVQPMARFRKTTRYKKTMGIKRLVNVTEPVDSAWPVGELNWKSPDSDSVADSIVAITSGITRALEIVPLNGPPGYLTLAYGWDFERITGHEVRERSKQVRHQVIDALEHLVPGDP